MPLPGMEAHGQPPRAPGPGELPNAPVVKTNPGFTSRTASEKYPYCWNDSSYRCTYFINSAVVFTGISYGAVAGPSDGGRGTLGCGVPANAVIASPHGLSGTGGVHGQKEIYPALSDPIVSPAKFGN